MWMLPGRGLPGCCCCCCMLLEEVAVQGIQARSQLVEAHPGVGRVIVALPLDEEEHEGLGVVRLLVQDLVDEVALVVLILSAAAAAVLLVLLLILVLVLVLVLLLLLLILFLVTSQIEHVLSKEVAPGTAAPAKLERARGLRQCLAAALLVRMVDLEVLEPLSIVDEEADRAGDRHIVDHHLLWVQLLLEILIDVEQLLAHLGVVVTTHPPSDVGLQADIGGSVCTAVVVPAHHLICTTTTTTTTTLNQALTSTLTHSHTLTYLLRDIEVCAHSLHETAKRSILILQQSCHVCVCVCVSQQHIKSDPNRE